MKTKVLMVLMLGVIMIVMMIFLSCLCWNEVFVGFLESDEYFNTAKLDEMKKWEHFEVHDEVKDVGQQKQDL